MNDDLDFDVDASDDELGRRFHALAADRDDTDAVLTGLRPRLARARRQRRAATALGTLAAVVLIAGTATAVLARTDRSSVSTPPAGQSSVSTPMTTPSPEPGRADTTPATADPSAHDQADDGTEAGATATTATVDDRDLGAAGGTSGSDGTGSTGASSPTTTSYESDGGSITVTFVDGVVSLASSNAAPGYTAEVHDNGPVRVEVRFTNADGEWRIRVDVVNGSLVPEVSHH